MHQPVVAPSTVSDTALVDIATVIVGQDAAMVALLTAPGTRFTEAALSAYEALLAAAETVLALAGDGRLSQPVGREKSAKILLTDLALGA